MKNYQPNEIKNIAFVGNAGSGKTTLAESICFAGGIINRKGDVDSKNTVSDFLEIEHEYNRSVFSTVLHVEWKDKKINYIDAPGLDDFIGGAISAFNVADTAINVVNAQQGVEVGTEIIGRHTERLHKPMMFVINHLDHEKTNYEKTLESLKDWFGAKATVIQYPVNPGLNFDSIIDVLTMKMYKYSGGNVEPQVMDIPDSEKDRAEQLRNELIEAAAENDEALMEKFFEAGSLTEDQMREGIKVGILTRGMFPIFCTAAKNNIGVTRLLDFIVNVIPTAVESPLPKTTDGKEIAPDTNAPASVFVFKSTVESHLGELNFFKVMSGKVTEGMDITNNTKNAKERLSQLFVVNGKNRTKVTELYAGDIGATVKLKETKTNHTLGVKGADYTFPPIKFPNAKYRAAIKTLNESDDEKLGEVLTRLRNEDPTLLVEYSKELKQIILSGQGEYHLNTVKWYFDNIFKIETEYVPPKIPYRETITKHAFATYRHKKQSGGAG